MRAARNSVAVVMFVGIALSCDDATAPSDSLTERQAVALLRELWDLSLNIPVSEPQCPFGGSVTGGFSSDRREHGDTTWFSGETVATPVDCVFRAGADTLTTNGDPSMTVFREYETVRIGREVELRFTMTIMGAVKWRTQDDRSESCGMDLKLESTGVDEDTGQFIGNMKGRLCGADMVIHLSELS